MTEPYGVPSPYEAHVKRRSVDWLTGDRYASISFTPLADLSGINLFRAKVTDEQLSQAKCLYRATMPDGGRYDGRLNLEGDIELARGEGIDSGDADAMAHWYAN